MYPNSIDFGLKVVPKKVLWGKVYTIWVHGPFGLSSTAGVKCAESRVACALKASVAGFRRERRFRV